ncbi:DUF3833 domain-containing protein [Catenovulum sediminis]|uniref:DUF3833 domain-containing protein n=1 Tax=Catenovulum sediminis TaxID=1740262 RepID=A0ABV1RG01_9ALTE|nr:DUF3833 domain-containing protein [Catenovulum sediminis]
MIHLIARKRVETVMIYIFAAFFLSACSTSIKEYDNTAPEFKLENYFTGKIKAWGMLQNVKGKKTRHFVVDIKACWQDNIGTLHESFEFDDGEKQTRIWTINKIKNGLYEGRANDVEGVASIYQKGSAVNLKYQLQISMDDTTRIFTIDDWMYQIDKTHVFNRSTISKFGVQVAELTLFFAKESDAYDKVSLATDCSTHKQ